MNLVIIYMGIQQICCCKSDHIKKLKLPNIWTEHDATYTTALHLLKKKTTNFSKDSFRTK